MTELSTEIDINSKSHAKNERIYLLGRQMTLKHQFLLDLLDWKLQHLVGCGDLVGQLGLLGLGAHGVLAALAPREGHRGRFTIYSLTHL